MRRRTDVGGWSNTLHAARAPHAMTDAEANDILNSMHAGDRRSTFAQALFPYDARRYKSRGEWAKTVGVRVAGDIQNNPVLRLEMQRLGYRPRTVGYTLEQRLTLIKFYKSHINQGV